MHKRQKRIEKTKNVRYSNMRITYIKHFNEEFYL